MEKQNAKDHKVLGDSIDEVKNLLITFIGKAEWEFAKKESLDRVRKIIRWIIWFVFTWLGGAILFLILK